MSKILTSSCQHSGHLTMYQTRIANRRNVRAYIEASKACMIRSVGRPALNSDKFRYVEQHLILRTLQSIYWGISGTASFRISTRFLIYICEIAGISCIRSKSIHVNYCFYRIWLELIASTLLWNKLIICMETSVKQKFENVLHQGIL